MIKHYKAAALGLIIVTMLSSCFHHHDMSVTVWDDEDEYEMDASYNKSRSHEVEVYLNDHLISNGQVSIHKNLNDDEIMLDDNSTIYISAHPGKLKIKIDKQKNTQQSVDEMKEICEDLKEILADN